jgi:hypothetical protein
MGRALGILATYVVVGPLIGLVVFAAGIALLAVANGQTQGAWLGPFFLLYGIVFAHFIGAPWAVLAGGVAVVLDRWRGKGARWIGAASGAASFAVAYVAGAARLPPGPESPVGQVVDGYGPGFALLMAVVHILSAAGAWGLARGLAGLVARKG